jgi:4-amino-4-deoxy-L-arabinose transferase-like glycosyltransferase
MRVKEHCKLQIANCKLQIVPAAAAAPTGQLFQLEVFNLQFAVCSVLLLVTAWFLFGYRLADRDLWSSHEARAAMNAQSVLDGKGALPRLFDGRPEVQKPPLYYWLVAAAARAHGAAVDAWAVRLPAALSACLCVLAVVLGLVWGCGRPGAGLLAGLILATANHFTWLGRIGRIDMPLTLAVTLAAGCGYLARRTPRQAWLAFAYLSTAVAVLLKGPVGLVLPAAILAGHLLLQGRWPACWELRAWRRQARELGLLWGVPLVLVLTLPVFAWAIAASEGTFAREFFWHHNVERGLGGSRLRSHAWWLYGPYFLLYFAPWSLFVPLAWLAARGRFWRGDPEAHFGLAWLVAVLAVLSCARFKRADYLLPAYPGAAVFLGCVLSRALVGAGRRARTVLCGGVISLAAAVVVSWALLLGRVLPRTEHYADWLERVLPRPESYRDYRNFAVEVRRHAPAPAEVGFFRTETHALAFRVGRPLCLLVEWQDLRARLGRPGPHYVVMPCDCVADCPRHLPGIRVKEVARNTGPAGGTHERPLALLRCTAASAPAPK